MREAEKFLFGVVGVLMATASAAHADRTMVVVIDASGSMQTLRGTEPRFDAAKQLAQDSIFAATMEVEGLAGVAVFTFHGAGIVSQTAGFVSPGTAQTTVGGLAVTSDLTPLAASLCDTIDIASASGTGATTSRLLVVFSDGGENNTAPAHACFGTHSTTGAPFDDGSWQRNVRQRALAASPAVTISTSLFTDVSFHAVAQRAANPEEVALAKAGRTAPLASLVSDEEFFTTLAADTNGSFRTIADAAPLPVAADLDADQDVDRADAIKLARQFGRTPTPAFDLNADDKIGFADYAILRLRFGTGTGTPDPDPFQPRQPVVCSAFQKVVINGQAIESSGVAIDARLGCVVEIKNSLIVSGQNAIQISGAASVKVDNSILVGENAVLVLTGGATLSAANTVFHGAKKLVGLLTYIDRGGNTWE